MYGESKSSDPQKVVHEALNHPLLDVDYRGATSAGMQALLMDIPGAYRDKGVPRVESLEELQIVLSDFP